MSATLPFRLFALSALASFLGLFGSTAGFAAPNAPRLHLVICYDALDDLESELDAPPRAVFAPPISVPESLAKNITSETYGFLTAQIDRTGRVRGIEFADRPAPGALARPIRETLKTWKFEPLRRRGVVKDAHLPLRFEARSCAQAVDRASQGLVPPRLAYAMRPALPPEFYSTFSSINVIRVPGEPIPLHVERAMPSRTGETQIQSFNTMIRAPDRFVSVPGDETEAQPWLSGSVVVDFTLDEQGIPRDPRVVESTCPVLEPEAVAAVPFWRYEPAKKEGVSVTSSFRDAVVFPGRAGASSLRFIQPLDDSLAKTAGYHPPEFTVFNPPVYPTVLARKKKRGSATVEVRLDSEGTVTDVAVGPCSQEDFGWALRESVLNSRFLPARLAEKAVESRFQLQAQFGNGEQGDAPRTMRIPAIDLRYTGKQQPLALEELDSIPRVISGRPPLFRTGSSQPDTAALVDLQLVVDAGGRVREPVVTSTSAPALDYTAVQTSASWLFEPPRKNGQPVAALVRVRVSSTSIQLVH